MYFSYFTLLRIESCFFLSFLQCIQYFYHAGSPCNYEFLTYRRLTIVCTTVIHSQFSASTQKSITATGKFKHDHKAFKWNHIKCFTTQPSLSWKPLPSCNFIGSECWVLNHGVSHRFLVGDDHSSFHLEFVHVSGQHVVVLNG